MKKIFVTFVILLHIFGVSYSQDSLQQKLYSHVEYLASDEMQGRAINSPQAEKTYEYITNHLSELGIKFQQFNVELDSLLDASNEIMSIVNDGEPEEQRTLTYHNIIANIDINNSEYPNEYMILMAHYTGRGVDTIKECSIIKNSALDNASGVATLLELAKYLSKNKHLLKRNIIFLFSEYDNVDEIALYWAKQNKDKKLQVCFSLRNLSIKNLEEYDESFDYVVPNLLDGASKIIQPILLKDVNLPTTAHYDTYHFLPVIEVNGGYLPYYEDISSVLNYESMANITNQLKEVIIAFNNSDIKAFSFDEIRQYNKEDSYDFTSIWREKNKSYFGINLLIGSNKHYYTEGRMTGKSAMSYSAGIFYKYPILRSCALKLDVNYERAYANRHDGRYKSDVLSVPLSFLFRLVSIESFEVYYGVGVYYDYTLSAKLNNQKVDWKLFNRNEFGWQFSLAWRFSNVILGYYQKIGISGMMNDAYGYSGPIKNRNQYFLLSFVF